MRGLSLFLLGIDTDRFTPGVALETPIQLVCTRGFTPVYNNEYLIQAMALLPADLPEFTFTFVSGGPQLDAARALAESVLPTTIRARVVFLGGVTGERLLELLQSAHIYASVSRSDGTSTSLLEALACGLYPILSDIPQNREWVSAELQNGNLVPLEQPEVLAPNPGKGDPRGRPAAGCRADQPTACAGARLESSEYGHPGHTDPNVD